MHVLHLDPEQFQQQVETCGKRLSQTITANLSQTPVQQKWLDLLIGQTISDPDFRIQALRFIDVLPSLDDDRDLAQHLQEYFSDLQLPRFAEWGLKHSDLPWVMNIAAPTVRYSLRGLARKFMGGSQLHHALTSVSRLRQQNMNFTLDLLGEATISESECQAYQQNYLQMLDSLSEPLTNWPHKTLLDISHGLVSPRLNLSIKLSSLYSQLQSVAPEDNIIEICKRLRPILHSAMQHNAFITIDMEQYDFKHIVLACFRQIIMEDDFKYWPHFGIALQAYLKDTYEDIQQLIDLLKQRGVPVTIRLVRGAYWDYETIIAKQNNWPSPVWEYKNETDFNYEKCLYLLLTSNDSVDTAIATHNPRSIAYAMALTEQLALTPDQFEFQMLYGMANSLKHALVKLNYRVRAYVPFGETLPGMAYLVRRLLENASGQSILDSGFSQQTQSLRDNAFQAPVAAKTSVQLMDSYHSHFNNLATLRFTEETERNNFSCVIDTVKQQLGITYPLVINNKEIFTDYYIDSYNPAKPLELIGQVCAASQSHAELAVQAAKSSFSSWSQTPVQQRADYLRRVAALLTKRRFEFATWQVLEAGKNWYEADADICEAIDFLNYYAQQAESLLSGKNILISGESNHINYRARGISLVIPPWNFPLAILCGMLSASIVTGNTCILKPSSLTPVIAAKFMQLWTEVNLPSGVINFLPGAGKTIGEYLARRSDVHIIAFTGSLQVGTQLLSIGAKIQPDQYHIKKVIAEMGGKNAIIIDSDADLDIAIIGTMQSAFGFQGQKCSAASRVIVLQNIYKRFIDRLLEAVSSLNIGDPVDPANSLGPVIDNVAFLRILQTIHHAKKTATLHNFVEPDVTNSGTDNGYFIKPCIFTDVDSDSPLAQEEIFGPVLSVIKADNFTHAINLANHTRYALTGGVYSRQPSNLLYARKNFQVGNLYLNRKITGALVGRQPFGGFNMSGAGSKAGDTDYLKQFMDVYCVTENTLRRGFAPDND